MNIFGFHFHSWLTTGNIFDHNNSGMMDSSYRECNECGSVQRFNWDSQGGSYSLIDGEEKLFYIQQRKKEKIVSSDYFDKKKI